MLKKLEEPIKCLIENGVKARHRSMFIIIGNKSLDQIETLHSMLSKSVVKSRPKVLWCYKDKLELSSHMRKRQKQIKTLLQMGLLDPEKVKPFSLFLETSRITYCLYKDSERILGNTFGLCILQDFEALTPNLLARTIETVEGGGLIVLLLRSLTSLISLYTMVMDVHKRFRTESHSQASGRFSERLLLSLASCKACIVMDDELNILPISSHMKSISPVSVREDSEGLSEAERDLKHLKEQLNDAYPVGPLLKNCCTLDQGKAVITFLDSILNKTPSSTVALLAARGRGKSAALGLAIAGAVAAGYSNIFVTAPSPGNLKTLFEFVCKGFDMLKYKEHLDYDVVKRTNTEFRNTIMQINIYRQHRQTIQYVQPHEHAKLSQVELLVVDEAAAIPCSIIKSLLGPYLVFISSTVNGHEGTGRSLSLKLLQQLEEQSQMSNKTVEGTHSGRLFKKIELSESIRYASGDPIESWLNALLCLDVTSYAPTLKRLPPPTECDLYHVNRDTLFSYNKDSEVFLQRMMALYGDSHYKNSPNDLQLMADAPAHHLFVLLGPVDESKNQLPDILCVVQVCLEGKISHKSAKKRLREGLQPFGDQIPRKFCEQFQDTVFPSLSGVRIMRIATHPSAMTLEYESVAVELLARYYEGQLTSISKEANIEDLLETLPTKVTEASEKASLLKENSNITGEHRCMVLKPLRNDDIKSCGLDEWGFFGPFYQDFRRRFIELLGSSFCSMDYKLAMSVLDPRMNFTELDPASSSNVSLKAINKILSPYDLKRLEAYTNNLADFHMILNLVPELARQYFLEKLPVTLSYQQASVLLCMGLQHKDIIVIEGEMKQERQQILSLFIEVMKKFFKYIYGIASKEIESTVPRLKEIIMEPHITSVDEDLNEAANRVQDELNSKMDDGFLNTDLLQRYVIADKEADFKDALQNGGKMLPCGLLSIKANRNKVKKHGREKEKEMNEKRRIKNDHGSKSNKKMKSQQY